VAELVDVVPGSAEWLAVRREGITATDIRIEHCKCPCANCSGCTGVYVDRAGTCGCGRPHPAGATACYVCELPLCLHQGDGCPCACECGCGECEALQARLCGDEEGEHDDQVHELAEWVPWSAERLT